MHANKSATPTLPIVERALENRIAANRAGNIGPETVDGRRAELALQAAYAAEKAHADMIWLRDKLNESIERVEAAQTAKEAHLGMAWLRTSLWNDIQAGLTRLELYDALLR